MKSDRYKITWITPDIDEKLADADANYCTGYKNGRISGLFAGFFWGLFTGCVILILTMLAGCSTVPICYRGDVTHAKTASGRQLYAYQRIIDHKAGMIVQFQDQQPDGWKELLKPDCNWFSQPTSIWMEQQRWDTTMKNGEIKIVEEKK